MIRLLRITALTATVLVLVSLTRHQLHPTQRRPSVSVAAPDQGPLAASRNFVTALLGHDITAAGRWATPLFATQLREPSSMRLRLGDRSLRISSVVADYDARSAEVFVELRGRDGLMAAVGVHAVRTAAGWRIDGVSR